MAPHTTAHALTPNGDHNTGDPVGHGPALDLLDHHPGAAIISPIRPDLVALDLDGTADLLDHIEDAAATVGAALVHLAASGSPDSLHAVYAPPTPAARDALVAAVTRIREWAGLPAPALAARSGREGLRLPGSPSLKPGRGPVVPVETTGGHLVALTPEDAAERARRAVEDAALPLTYPAPRTRTRRGTTTRTPSPAPVDLGVGLDAKARDALDTPPPAGCDRSGHALKAARHVYRCGARTWEAAAPILTTAPATAGKWTPTDGPRRWALESARWETDRPTLTPHASRLVEDAARAGVRLPAHLEAALAVVLDRIRRAGLVEGVGVACRDLVLGGAAASVPTASRYLADLEAHGVLHRSRAWEDGPATEATEWTLRPVEDWAGLTGDTSETHLTPPITLPVGGPLAVWTLGPGHTARRLLDLLRCGASSSSVLAEALRVSVRSARRLLGRLQAAGLVGVSRSGRSVVWSATGVRVEDCPAGRGALRGWASRCRQVRADRVDWARRVEVEGVPVRVRCARRPAASRWGVPSVRRAGRGGGKQLRLVPDRLVATSSAAVAGLSRWWEAARAARSGVEAVRVDLDLGGTSRGVLVGAGRRKRVDPGGRDGPPDGPAPPGLADLDNYSWKDTR